MGQTFRPFKGDQQPVVNMREEFQMRRDYMHERLVNIPGVSAVKPSGAFYILANISKFSLTSPQSLAKRGKL